jgi:pyruvate dehydrogenase E2 component (dihydrolipoamide acetyltransferase)
MSEASRVAVLIEAVKIHPKGSAAEVLATAEAFHAFVQGDGPKVAAASTPAADPKPTAAPKTDAKPQPSKTTTKAEPKSEPKAEAKPEPKAEPAAEDPKKAVSKAIASLISNNLRAEAVGLLERFGANSVSSLKADDYAAVIDEAQALLAAA